MKFLIVPTSNGLAVVPAELRKSLGELVFFTKLSLNKGEKRIALDVDNVLLQIQEKGYGVQENIPSGYRATPSRTEIITEIQSMIRLATARGVSEHSQYNTNCVVRLGNGLIAAIHGLVWSGDAETVLFSIHEALRAQNDQDHLLVCLVCGWRGSEASRRATYFQQTVCAGPMALPPDPNVHFYEMGHGAAWDCGPVVTDIGQQVSHIDCTHSLYNVRREHYQKYGPLYTLDEEILKREPDIDFVCELLKTRGSLTKYCRKVVHEKERQVMLNEMKLQMEATLAKFVFQDSTKTTWRKMEDALETIPGVQIAKVWHVSGTSLEGFIICAKGRNRIDFTVRPVGVDVTLLEESTTS